LAVSGRLYRPAFARLRRARCAIHCRRMERRALLIRLAALVSGSTSALSVAEAPPRATRRLAVLLFDDPAGWEWLVPELRDELAQLGWIEGKNLSVQWSYANSDAARLRSLAAQIVAAAPDVILTRGSPATRALQDATKTIPIATGVGDPIGSGFARTYAEPMGNITGVSYAFVETSEKFVEFLRLLVPGLSHLVAVLQADRVPFIQDWLRPVKAASRAGGVTVQPAFVANLADLRRALRIDPTRGSTAALFSNLGSKVGVSYEAVAAVALEARMPSMFEHRGFVDAGGLASYRLNWERQTQRSAAQIDKLFRGVPPGKIPFELPTRQELVLNLKTARALGLTVPQSLLVRADAIVE
jgi:putative ABC transport system substrate-binding protein